MTEDLNMAPEGEQEAIDPFYCIPLEDGKKILADIDAELTKYHKDEMDEIGNARAFAWGGDEWRKVRTRVDGGDNLNLNIASGMVTLATGVVCDNDFYISVRAITKPAIDEAQAEYFKQFSIPLAVDPSRPEWLTELLGEIKTHEIDTYRREVKLRPKVREAFHRALVDKCCVLKDVVVPGAGPKALDVDVVVYGDEYRAQRHRDYSKVAWHDHVQYLEKADFTRKYPWIIEKYVQDGTVAGTKGFFQRFYRKPDKDQVVVSKRKELDKPSIRVREVWYKMPADRPGADQFPGGFIVMTVFEDEILSIEPNPFADGRHPFHPIVPYPAEDHWAGKSWAYAFHDAIMGMNKSVSMALYNLIESCNNYRLWNPAAFQNPEEIQRAGAGTRDLILKAGSDWDKAVKEMNPASVSPAIFQVHDLVKGILYWASGVGANQPPQMGPDGKKVGGGGAMGPTFGGMMDIVKEALESLAMNFVSRGTQFAIDQRSFTLAGESNVSITINPAVFAQVYGDQFYNNFMVIVEEQEPQSNDPNQRTRDMLDRMEAAAKMSDLTQRPLEATIAITKPYGWSLIVRDLKRARLEAQQNPQDQQPSPKELEQKAQAEVEKIKTMSQVWQARWQEKARDPVMGQIVDRLLASGQLRASLEAALAGNPFNMAVAPVGVPVPEAHALGQVAEAAGSAPLAAPGGMPPAAMPAPNLAMN